MPGVNGAVKDNKFKDMRFVTTGLFPEVGGGGGLSLGNDKTKKMIESFGGRVTSSISGKADYIIIRKEPGSSKVSAARNRGVVMLDLRQLRQLLLGKTELEALKGAPPHLNARSRKWTLQS